MLLQACLNGSRTPGEHPMLPITPQELGQELLNCAAIF